MGAEAPPPRACVYRFDRFTPDLVRGALLVRWPRATARPPAASSSLRAPWTDGRGSEIQRA
jgi:hypothetical protein